MGSLIIKGGFPSIYSAHAQNVNKPFHRLTVPTLAPCKLKLSPVVHKKKGLGGMGSKLRSVSLEPSSSSKTPVSPGGPRGSGGPRRVTQPVIIQENRPMSCNLDSLSQFDQSMQRRSNALSISPRMLRSWVARKSSTRSKCVHIYFPTHSIPSFDKIRSVGGRGEAKRGEREGGGRGREGKERETIPTPTPNIPHRSPGSKPPGETSHTEVLFIALENIPGVAPQLYTPQPGQVFMVEDVSQMEVWKVKALSGEVAGQSVWVQRNCLEEYSAPISLRPLKKEYRVLNTLSGYVWKCSH